MDECAVDFKNRRKIRHMNKTLISQRKSAICDVCLYIGLTAFTIVTAVFSLGKGVDFANFQAMADGDTTFMLMITQAIRENGVQGIFFIPRLGAPDISTMIDFPVIDLFSAFVLWAVSWFTDSTAANLYLFFIVSFPIDAVAMAILLRKLYFNRSSSFVSAAIFAFAPYHFFRGFMHATLILYVSVPIAIYLSLCIRGYFKNEKKRSIVFFAVFLGFCHGYYYAFGLIVMTLAVLMRFFQDQSFKKIKNYVWIPCVTLVSVLIALAPKIIYATINGANEIVGVRYPLEQEHYGLKIIQLLMPPRYTRFNSLGEVVAEYSANAPLVTENAFASLGIVTAFGFCALCVAFLYSFCNKGEKRKEWQLVDFLSLSTLAFVVVGTIGGFGEVFNFLVTAQIRCYNRSSIFIAGMSLVMVALLLNRMKFRRKWTTWLICIAILCGSMYDTIYKYPDNWQETAKPIQEMYEEYFAAVEDSFGESDMIYQLPYLDFPEVGPHDYKHFIAYLYTHSLRWSYGGVKGRNNGARVLLDNNGESYLFLKNIKDAGFSAVYIDTGMYDDGASVLSFYNALGVKPMVSVDGRYYIYDIRSLVIDENMLQPGYSFVDSWNTTHGQANRLSKEQLGEIAEGIAKHNMDSYEELFNLISDTDIVQKYSNREFVEFLYKSILKRDAEPEGCQAWIEQLEEGATRKIVFYGFLNSAEFRIGQGYEKIGVKDDVAM